MSIYLPYDAARSWDYLRDINSKIYAEHPTEQTLKAATDAAIQATFGMQLSQALQDRHYWFALAILTIGPPLVIYVVASLVFAIARWVSRGFTTP